MDVLSILGHKVVEFFWDCYTVDKRKISLVEVSDNFVKNKKKEIPKTNNAPF